MALQLIPAYGKVGVLISFGNNRRLYLAQRGFPLGESSFFFVWGDEMGWQYVGSWMVDLSGDISILWLFKSFNLRILWNTTIRLKLCINECLSVAAFVTDAYPADTFCGNPVEKTL